MDNVKIAQWADENMDDLVKDLISVVNIRSVSEVGNAGPYPYGEGCKQALDKTLEIAGRMGFETMNHEYYCGSAIWRGETEDEIGLFGHLDVVPEGIGWTYEPYNAVFKDGKVIGRGACDNKGPTIASMYAMKYLKESGIKLKHTIRMYFGCSEEKGMSDIRYYLEHNPMPKFGIVPDCNFPVCTGEKGILELDITGAAGTTMLEFRAGEVSNMVPPYSHVVLAIAPAQVKKALEGLTDSSFTIEESGTGTKVIARGKAGHAAWPEPAESAMVKLVTALDKTEGLLDPKGKACISFLAQTFADYYGDGINANFSDETGRLTHVGGMINIKDGNFTQNVNIRYPVKVDQEKMVSNIREVCEKAGYSMTVLKNDQPFYIPPSDPVIMMLMDTCNEILHKEYKPYVMGFTYARRLKRAVAYGPGVPDKPNPAHQPDESMDIEDFRNAILIYANVIRKMDDMI
ncbi:MAG: Sapep family Mn(2+)-dependent dipeptidase [Negativicutes bacterium]